MKLKCLMMVAAVCVVGGVSAEVTLNITKAQQRWPWNNVVDVDFAIGGAAEGEQFVIELSAVSVLAGKSYSAKTYASEPVVKAGTCRVSWDFGADYPDLQADDMQFTVAATPILESTLPTYLVIDLSGGKDAAKWPVKYTHADPVHTPKCQTDACKLTELWMKRVHSKGDNFTTLTYVKPADNNKSFYSRLTHDFYLGLFEVTQQQWYQLTGNWSSGFSNVTWRATRPFDAYYPDLFFGSNGYSYYLQNWTPKSGSLLEKIRNRTGLSTLCEPTEAQWMYALHNGSLNGSETWYYRNANGTALSLKATTDGNQYLGVGRYNGNAGSVSSKATADLDNGTAAVGCYAPNRLGFYDMIGNVSEDLLDPFVTHDNSTIKNYYIEHGYEFPILDSKGVPYADAVSIHGSFRSTRKSLGWSNGADYSQCWYVISGYTNYSSDSGAGYRGVRFCVTCE